MTLAMIRKKNIVTIPKEFRDIISEGKQVKFVRTERGLEMIPVRAIPEKLNAETLKAFEEAEAGIGLSRSFDNVEEFLADLKNPDTE